MNNDLIYIIINKKKQISIFVIFFVIIGLVYSILSTPLYTSTVSIYPSNNESSINSMNNNLGNMISQFQNLGFSSGSLGGQRYHIKDLVESDELKRSIIKQRWNTNQSTHPLTLVEFWELDQNNYDSFLTSIKNFIYSVMTDSLEEIRLNHAISLLNGRIKVVEEDSGLFIINVLMEEPKLAADIANYIAIHLQDYISQKSTDKARKNKLFIKDRLKLAKTDLNDSEKKLMEFVKKNPTMDIPEVQFENLRLTRNLEINQELYITILKEYEISKIEELKELDNVYILDSAKPAIKKTKPNLILVLILMCNFSLFSIITFYLMYDYYKKNK